MLRLVARPLIAAPVRARTCAFLTKVKSMEAASAKIAGSMPDGLKEIADAGTTISADMEAFAKDRPELYKAVLAAIAEADKPGIQATVSEAKAPSSCKYTEEGTMVHELMQNIAKADRRMRAVSALEVTLTAADKEALKQAQLTKAAELGLDPSDYTVEVPEKMTVGF